MERQTQTQTPYVQMKNSDLHRLLKYDQSSEHISSRLLLSIANHTLVSTSDNFDLEDILKLQVMKASHR